MWVLFCDESELGWFYTILLIDVMMNLYVDAQCVRLSSRNKTNAHTHTHTHIKTQPKYLSQMRHKHSVASPSMRDVPWNMSRIIRDVCYLSVIHADDIII